LFSARANKKRRKRDDQKQQNTQPNWRAIDPNDDGIIYSFISFSPSRKEKKFGGTGS